MAIDSSLNRITTEWIGDTLKITTNKFSPAIHSTAENMIGDICKDVGQGNPVSRQHKAGVPAHTHTHDGITHSH